MLPAGQELTTLRGVCNATLTDTAVIQQPVEVIGPGGDPETTWTTTATVACRVAARASDPREVAVGGRITALMLWKIRLPWNTVVAPQYRIVANGSTFEVVDTDDAKSTKLQLVVNCRRLT